MFLKRRWSPEQIAVCLKLENYPIQISYKTIYRFKGNRGAIRHLRHKGKIPVSNELSARPNQADERSRLGDFEADTVLGQPGKACLS